MITGVVVDETGEPSPNTQVRAYRYVLTNGQRTLQPAGQDQTDDRGIYRIFQLQPGDYLVSAAPRNQGAGSDVRAQMQAQLEPLCSRCRPPAERSALLGGRWRRRRLAAALVLVPLVRPSTAWLPADAASRCSIRCSSCKQQLQQQPDEQSTAYAPVYYPGTTSPASATKVTLGIGEEKAGVDFQLQLVPTARVQGTVVGPEPTLPQGHAGVVVGGRASRMRRRCRAYRRT